MVEILCIIVLAAMGGLLFVAADKLCTAAIDAAADLRGRVLAWWVVDGATLPAHIRKFVVGVVAYRAVTGRWPTRFTMRCWWAGVIDEEWMATLHEEQVIAHRRW